MPGSPKLENRFAFSTPFSAEVMVVKKLERLGHDKVVLGLIPATLVFRENLPFNIFVVSIFVSSTFALHHHRSCHRLN